jgi:hypothetical protein
MAIPKRTAAPLPSFVVNDKKLILDILNGVFGGHR